MGFLSKHFFLQNKAARILYHEYAKDMPIYDYHCHLPPQDIAENRQFNNLAHIWLAGDHYKWRAMRANGVAEHLITGDADDWEKFQAWADTVPYTIRNPLYHWTHLELKRFFWIKGKLLSPETAREIYDQCTALLQREEFRARRLMERMNVKIVCTTDDPVDSLEYHRQIQQESGFDIKVLPTFRPDKAMAVESPENFRAYLEKLAEAADVDITNFSTFLEAIRARLQFFHEVGCRISDHAVIVPPAADFTETEVAAIFDKVRGGSLLDSGEVEKFRSAVMYALGQMYHEHGWAMQIHIGALRSNNTRMFTQLGTDTGFDSMADLPIAAPLARFLDRLDINDTLPKTILYSLNPCDNDVIASMIGNFQDGNTPGKMQFGSGWWFNDQKNGMIRQMEALSNSGLLSRFVGMLTDSRSFLSYPRHEYFRRILCNLIGTDVEHGELPDDLEHLGKIVQDICYNNAVKYFGIDL